MFQFTVVVTILLLEVYTFFFASFTKSIFYFLHYLKYSLLPSMIGNEKYYRSVWNHSLIWLHLKRKSF